MLYYLTTNYNRIGQPLVEKIEPNYFGLSVFKTNQCVKYIF
jgi:hypothetical protein